MSGWSLFIAVSQNIICESSNESWAFLIGVTNEEQPPTNHATLVFELLRCCLWFGQQLIKSGDEQGAPGCSHLRTAAESCPEPHERQNAAASLGAVPKAVLCIPLSDSSERWPGRQPLAMENFSPDS